MNAEDEKYLASMMHHDTLSNRDAMDRLKGYYEIESKVESVDRGMRGGYLSVLEKM